MCCSLSDIETGSWYAQTDQRWANKLLGFSDTDTLGDSGCAITAFAMIYHNVWHVPTEPDELNESAKLNRCFPAGSSLAIYPCVVNSRGGPHGVTEIAMASVPQALCHGHAVMVNVTWGAPTGHKLRVS